ncbi:MAG: cytochrome c biogenesis protein ResB [Candidatus Bipolaricaulota bacterium]|nr:cytochrome c biogenesis protein ResB [Candidatus Bipolaricaulota bacterium]MDW8030327.1 cytochrome c biogenesis protein ResB [Candidatus Bipolaricaulota bacterium]
MTCTACGTVNTPDSRFCKYCGVALHVLCRACGTTNDPDSRFCKMCGVSLTAAAPAPPPRATQLAIDGALRGKVAEVVKVLGGLNCGRCGYRTCAENALAIVRGEAPPHSCVQGGEEAARQIRTILGQPERPSLGSLLGEQLTSIRLAIVLIVVIVVLSIVGTLIPQGRDLFFYIASYGEVGARIIQALQLNQIYHSWYFVSLLVLLAINTGACALKRFRVSWELVRKPIETRAPEEIAHLPTQTKLDAQLFNKLEETLNRWRYRVRREGSQLVAYKNLWGRLGVDILHVSLIIILVGGIIGGLLGFESFQIAHQGETFSVPQGNFQVRVDELRVEHYPDSGQVKDWYTTLTVIEDGREVLTKTIEVNEPLTYKGISFYQASFGSDWLGGAELTFRVERVQEGNTEPIGEFTAKVGTTFSLDDGRTVKVVAFYPDFIVTEDRRPANRSQALNNPAAFLEVYNGDQREFTAWTFAQFPQFQHEFMGSNPYRFYLVGMKAPEFTGLQIARNPGIPIIYAGFVLLIFGLVLNFYLPPRRIWAAVKGEILYVGGLGREPREFEPEFEEIIATLTLASPLRAPGERPEVKGSKEEVHHG